MEFVNEIINIIAYIIGIIGTFIIVYGIIVSFYQFLLKAFGKKISFNRLRTVLGRHLILGLEFLIGKDILESILDPSWDDLGKLGAIILIRTVLEYFLSKGIKE